MKINWSKIGHIAKEFIKSLSMGDIVLRVRLDKLFPFTLYLFFLGCLSILLGYTIEQTMLTAEKNKTTIKILQIDNAKKTFDIVELSRISTVSSVLKNMGSDVKAPDKPADILE